jgi:folate-dependent phosphoribosylglycinamide formyltransferase PurN
MVFFQNNNWKEVRVWCQLEYKVITMKIGLLTNSSLSEFQLKTLNPILKDDSFSIKVAIIDNRPPKSLIQRLEKNIIRGRGGYIIIMTYKEFFSKKSETCSTKNFCSHHGIDIINTKDPYSDETIEQIKKYGLDVLLLVGGFGIVKSPILNLTPIGVLSYHHGDMRKYRGQPPAFWELYNHEMEMGVTVQVLDSGLDCGIPIEEKTIQIKNQDTVKKLQNRAMEESIDMMYKALKKLSNNNFNMKKIENLGIVYTLPNLTTWLMLELKILLRCFKKNCNSDC